MKGAFASPAARQVLRHELRDSVRGRWAPAYAVFFLVVTDALFRFAGGGDQVILSLVNVVVLLVPLVSLVLGSAYLYGSRDLVELLLAQPVRRGDLFARRSGCRFHPGRGGNGRMGIDHVSR